MNIDLNITINGDVSEDYIKSSMEALGELILGKIRENIDKMGLVGTGMLKQHWVSSYSNGVLRIESTEEHSIYIEFGTYGYWNKNGLDKFTDPSHPKKKDLSIELRRKFPKGMQSFAPVRKVVYNPTIMNELVQTAFDSQL
jgi:hypothetical protein